MNESSDTTAPELPIERLFAIDWHVWRALEWARVERGVVR